MSSRLGRVVLLSYYFPPLIGVASERSSAFSRHLPALGWDTTVVTVQSGHFDRASDDDAPVASKVVRTRSLELSRIARRAYGAATGSGLPRDDASVRAVQTGSTGARLRELARDWAYVPDAQVGWIPFASRAATALLAEGGGPRVIVSSSVPYSAHLAAMRTARRHGVPWVAEFRDPWCTGRAPEQLRSAARTRLDKRLERRILTSADHVVVTASALRDAILKEVPDLAERVSVITNGFEPSDPGSPPAPHEPLLIVYAGSVATGEDPAPLLDALDRVHAADPGAFRLRVVGAKDAWQRPPGPPWLELDGVTSPRRARSAMADASALLLLQRHSAHRDIVPGKTFEYAGVRRPILALVPPDNQTAAILRNHADARLVAPDRPEEAAAAVEQLIREHRAGELQAPRVSERVTAPLTRHEQARALAAILGNLSARRAG